jgi:hypothetical protein
MKSWIGGCVGILVLTVTVVLAGSVSDTTAATSRPTCADIRNGLDRPDVVDVDDVDVLMHAAGCDQNEDGSWTPERDQRCARRAYWLVQHGHSIMRTTALLSTRGCGQYEDGTFFTK